MPVSAASRSINLSDDLVREHDVRFLVHSTLTGADLAPLNELLHKHLTFLQGLRKDGRLVTAGPFFTEDGKNTGDGFYVLRVDSADEARRLAAEDPMHKAGVRRFFVQPWLQEVEP